MSVGLLTFEEIEKSFCIGDLVQLNSSGFAAQCGATATVVEFKECIRPKGLYYLSVKWVRDGLSRGQCDGEYYAGDFSVVSRINKEEMENNCPRCSGELREQMSFGLGEIIKKCGDCGWC